MKGMKGSSGGLAVGKQAALSAIFGEEPLLGWEMIDMESCLYAEANVTIEGIALLTSLYMKIIERLNTLQDPREKYFSLKMQKLMAEPYVIRCFNTTTACDPADSTRRNALDSRRKELELRLEKEVERHNHRRVLQQVITAQEEKEEKLKRRVREIVEQSDRALEQRIRRRNEIKEMRNSVLSSSQLAASHGSICFDSPPFASGRTARTNPHSRMLPSSSFELQEDGDYLRAVRREVEEEEWEERVERRLRREGVGEAEMER